MVNRRARREAARVAAQNQGLKGTAKQRMVRQVARQLPGGADAEQGRQILESHPESRRGLRRRESGLVVPD